MVYNEKLLKKCNTDIGIFFHNYRQFISHLAKICHSPDEENGQGQAKQAESNCLFFFDFTIK
jgi:hypothetical protein